MTRAREPGASNDLAQPYSVTFLPAGRTLTAHEGETILHVAQRAGVELDHACGGCCACSTCHVKIVTGSDALAAASEREEDMLDLAPGVTSRSRLACCAVVEADLVVEVPAMNRNLVSEDR